MARHEAVPPIDVNSTTETFVGLSSKELDLLREISSVMTPTVITTDVAITSGDKLLRELGLTPNGWQLISTTDGWRYQESRGIEAFLARFREVFDESFFSYIKKHEGSLRLGGSVFTTTQALLELRPEIERGACFVPVGQIDETNSEVGKLMKYVNRRRGKLITELRGQLDDRLFIHETLCPGVTPICVSLYSPGMGSRSMLIIIDRQKIMVPHEAAVHLKKPSLLLVDTREFAGENYLQTILHFAAQPDVFTVVGMGAASILPDSMDDLRKLQSKTQGELAFAGNRGEIEALVNHWDGVNSPPKLVREAKIRFLLETNGQKGAKLYLRLGEDIHSAEYKLPEEEIFSGDTTNAGDMFLAVVLAELMKLPYGEEPIQPQLTKVLQEASRETLRFLQTRSTIK